MPLYGLHDRFQIHINVIHGYEPLGLKTGKNGKRRKQSMNVLTGSSIEDHGSYYKVAKTKSSLVQFHIHYASLRII